MPRNKQKSSIREKTVVSSVGGHPPDRGFGRERILEKALGLTPVEAAKKRKGKKSTQLEIAWLSVEDREAIEGLRASLDVQRQALATNTSALLAHTRALDAHTAVLKEQSAASKSAEKDDSEPRAQVLPLGSSTTG